MNLNGVLVRFTPAQRCVCWLMSRIACLKRLNWTKNALEILRQSKCQYALVPSPFTNQSNTKRRPAVIISNKTINAG